MLFRSVHNGAAKCWGRNNSGQLGDGTTTNSVTPVAVSELTSSVTAIATGYRRTCAIHDGAAKCWGGGPLGDGTSTNSLIPVAVSGLASGVTAISIGCTDGTCTPRTCAIHDGAAKCWGYGALGDGTGTGSLIPVAVSGLASGVTAIAASYNHACAIHNGAAKCWGSNGFGQLGDGSTTNSLIPVVVSGLTSGGTAIAIGVTHSCAMHSGVAKCWGGNWFGQLGDGLTTNSSIPVVVSGLAASAICGDGSIAGDEQCDLGAILNGTAGSCCSATCEFLGAATECRGSVGECDVAETCDGASGACPDDVKAASGTTCGSATDDACTDGDTCNDNGTCAANDAAADTVCSSDFNACTRDVCDGTGTCTHPAGNSGTQCRPAAAGECDVAETCDGASASCPSDQFVSEGTLCNAAGPCTSGACQAGACAEMAAPREDCRVVLEPLAAKLTLKDSTKDSKDQLSWDWKLGQATTLADLGGPTQPGGAAYELCMYDESGPEPAVVLSAEVAPGAGWAAQGAKGYKFSDKAGTQGGIKQILAKSGADGKASLQIDGKGAGLGLPALPLGLPARVQLEVVGGVCFEATFSSAGTKKNDARQFQGQSD